MRKLQLALLIVILASLVVGAYFYPLLPPTIATHFNLYGVPDGYSPKLLGALLFPVIILCVGALLTFLPKLRTPYSENFPKFINYYDQLVALVCLFLLVIYFQMLWLNTGHYTDFFNTVPIGLGVLLFFAGLMCLHSKRNWFAGIRTPWTISDERVWDKVNQVGGRCMQVLGILDVLVGIFSSYSLVFVIASVVLLAVLLVIYSYYVFGQIVIPGPGGKVTGRTGAAASKKSAKPGRRSRKRKINPVRV